MLKHPPPGRAENQKSAGLSRNCCEKDTAAEAGWGSEWTGKDCSQ